MPPSLCQYLVITYIDFPQDNLFPAWFFRPSKGAFAAVIESIHLAIDHHHVSANTVKFSREGLD